MTVVENINHDSGGAVSAHWTKSVTDTSGRLSITVGAALGGSAMGLDDTKVAGSNQATIIEATSAPASNELRFGFRYDPNSPPTPGSNTSLITVEVRELAATYGAYLIRIALRITSAGEIRVSFSYGDDTGGGSFASHVVTDEPHCYSCKIVRATDATSSDGTVEFFIDSVSKNTATGRDNFDHFAAIDEIVAFLWANSLSYTHYLDEVVLDDFGDAAICSSHLWLSTDGAITFSDIGNPSWAVVGAVVVKPGTNWQTIWAVSGTILYKTVDQGANWSQVAIIGYEVDFMDLLDGDVIFVANRASGGQRASLIDDATGAITHISIGKSTTGGATSGAGVA